MKITIFGSCRQHSLHQKYSVTDIQEILSYTHNTKEILEVIKYCKNNHIHPYNTIKVFRTPILTKKSPNFNIINSQFKMTDLFILEIASKKKYRFKNVYVHHIALEDEYNVDIKDKIIMEIQSKDEIENDILDIMKELNKPIIIISHLITKNIGERYELSNWLEEICFKYKIPFINPIKELKNNDKDIEFMFADEPVLAHYNEYGHQEILKIYQNVIDKLNIN